MPTGVYVRMKPCPRNAGMFVQGQVARNKGLPMSDEQRAKVRAAWKLRPNVAPDIEPVPPVPAGAVLSHASLNVRRWRAAAFLILGSKCVRCGFSDVRALQIDHVNGGGSKERVQVFKGSPRAFYKAVIADQRRSYQMLCANCNQIKRIEKGEY